jgi:hypothetical protein
MNKNLLLGGSVLTLIAIGWALSHKSPVPLSAKPHSENPMRVRTTASAVDVNTPARAAVQDPIKRDIASIPKTAATIPINLSQGLLGYKKLHAKTFLNSQEEVEKKEMLSNSEFIGDLGRVLSDTSMMQDPHYEEMENAALDLIVEALQKGDRESSLQVIQSIIQDPQVENTQLPQKVRETLAGIKGELLYHAVAFAPNEFSNIESLLPGPVSQKIWQNVQGQHQQNFNESQVEVQEREQTSGRR